MITVTDFPDVAVGVLLKIVACQMRIVPIGRTWCCSAVVDGITHMRVSRGPHAYQLIAAIEALAERVAMARKARAS